MTTATAWIMRRKQFKWCADPSTNDFSWGYGTESARGCEELLSKGYASRGPNQQMAASAARLQYFTITSDNTAEEARCALGRVRHNLVAHARRTRTVRRRRELHAATGRALRCMATAPPTTLRFSRVIFPPENAPRRSSASRSPATGRQPCSPTAKRRRYERALPPIGEDDLARRAACLHKLALATSYDNIDATVR